MWNKKEIHFPKFVGMFDISCFIDIQYADIVNTVVPNTDIKQYH